MNPELAELLEFVRGNRWPFTPGLSVPKQGDDNAKLMAAMRELEQLGLVMVRREDERRIDWIACPTPRDSVSNLKA